MRRFDGPQELAKSDISRKEEGLELIQPTSSINIKIDLLAYEVHVVRLIASIGPFRVPVGITPFVGFHIFKVFERGEHIAKDHGSNLNWHS